MGNELDKWFLDNEPKLRDIIERRFRSANMKGLEITSKINTLYANWAERKMASKLKNLDNPGGFFWTAARNIVSDEIRKAERQVNIQDRKFSTSEDSLTELTELVSKFLNGLSLEHRQILVLHRVEGFKLSEVAEAIGSSESRVEREHIKIKLKIERFQKGLTSNGIDVNITSTIMLSGDGGSLD